MADHAFEAQLGRMFAETPRAPDADLFAAQVEERLGRGWAARQVGMAAAGLLGAVIAIGQTLNANVLAGLGDLQDASRDAISEGFARVSPQLMTLTASSPYAVEVIWVTAALAGAAIAFIATRMMDQA